MIESQKSNFERSVLVGVTNDSQNEEKLNEFLEELEKFEPEIIKACDQALKKGVNDLDFLRINEEFFQK